MIPEKTNNGTEIIRCSDRDPMKKTWLVAMAVLVLLSGSTGCVSQPHNKYITVTSPDIDNLTPVNIGSVDMYTPQFQITNPTNRTFSHVGVQIDIDPQLTYCHSLSKTIDIPALSPMEKRTEILSLAEFNDLYCQYSYTYNVVSDP